MIVQIPRQVEGSDGVISKKLAILKSFLSFFKRMILKKILELLLPPERIAVPSGSSRSQPYNKFSCVHGVFC